MTTKLRQVWDRHARRPNRPLARSADRWLGREAAAVALLILTITLIEFLVKALFVPFDQPLWRFTGPEIVAALVELAVLVIAVSLIVHWIFRVQTLKYGRTVLELVESERRFLDIADNSNEWFWEVDEEGRYTYASPVVERILGYTPAEVIGKHFYDLFHPDDREQVKAAAFEAMAARQPFQDFINRNLHKNGTSVWLATSGVAVLGTDGTLIGYRGADRVASDAPSMKDLLTGLLSREGFELLGKHQYELSLRNRLPMALLFADMDNLKQINDRFGHVEGDRALTEIGKLLAQSSRSTDTVCRLGGDEFVILINSGSDVCAAAETIIRQIQHAIEQTNARKDRGYPLSISIAYADFDPDQPQSLHELLNEADARMYRVKRSKQATD